MDFATLKTTILDGNSASDFGAVITVLTWEQTTTGELTSNQIILTDEDNFITHINLFLPTDLTGQPYDYTLNDPVISDSNYSITFANVTLNVDVEAKRAIKISHTSGKPYIDVTHPLESPINFQSYQPVNRYDPDLVVFNIIDNIRKNSFAIRTGFDALPLFVGATLHDTVNESATTLRTAIEGVTEAALAFFFSTGGSDLDGLTNNHLSKYNSSTSKLVDSNVTDDGTTIDINSKLSFNHSTGELTLNQYGVRNITGTESIILAFNSAGKLIESSIIRTNGSQIGINIAPSLFYSLSVLNSAIINGSGAAQGKLKIQGATNHYEFQVDNANFNFFRGNVLIYQINTAGKSFWLKNIEFRANLIVRSVSPTGSSNVYFHDQSGNIDIELKYNNGSSLFQIIAKNSTGSGNEGDIHFLTKINITRLVIKREGNIGIGTTDPDRKLDVNGAAKIRSFLELVPITSATSVNNSIFIDSADNALKFRDNTGTVRTFDFGVI